MSRRSFHEMVAEHDKWSTATFGPNFRPKAITDHIRKECDEVDKDPYDTVEWIDILILAMDGAIRSGKLDGIGVLDAWAKKHDENVSRQWPDWRNADPDKAIEHIR